jgi:O-antigen/teichoic acid export membrane protein
LSASSPRIAVRFTATLAANVVSAGTGFLVSLILARGLGPKEYGNYAFLLASFGAFNSWLDGGSSAAFYTFLSGGESRRLHIRLYGAWLAARFALLAILAAALPHFLFRQVWFENSRALTLWGLGAYFLSIPGQSMIVQVFESMRRTLEVQTALVAVSVAHLIAVAALLLCDLLSVESVFALVVAEYLLLALFAAWRNRDVAGESEPPAATAGAFAQYRAYCLPLFVYTAVTAFAQFGDRWLLQFFGGSLQQGLFSVSQQFGTVALMATAALINILWKEIAAAESVGDTVRSASLFLRSSRFLFAVSAGIGAFLAPQCRELTPVLLGASYTAAWPALSLLMLYPAFQSLSQLNAVYFYATKQIRLHVFLSSTATLVAIPFTYFVLASPQARLPGLGWGATGLAARWVIFQILFVAWQSRAVAKLQSTTNETPRRLLVVGVLLAIACAAKAIASAALAAAGFFNPFATLAVSGILFGATALTLGFRFPEYSGVEKFLIDALLEKIRSRAAGS